MSRPNLMPDELAELFGSLVSKARVMDCDPDRQIEAARSVTERYIGALEAIAAESVPAEEQAETKFIHDAFAAGEVYCDLCLARYTEGEVEHFKFRFCPNCGAKVVD